jgi:diguanylate cyclase (GGDEF)-like protein/PAS domain S-box-containing protein
MASKPKHSLRRRIVIAFTSLQIFAVLLLGVFLVSQGTRAELEARRSLAKNIIQLARPTIIQMIVNHDAVQLKAYLQKLVESPSIASIHVNDVNQFMLFTISDKEETPGLLASFLIPDGARQIKLRQDLYSNGIEIGYMEIQLSNGPINQRITSLFLDNFLLLLALLLISVLASYKLLRSLTTPLRQLNKVASQFAEGNWKATPELRHADFEEFQELENAMSKGARLITSHIEELEHTQEILQRNEDQLRTLVNNMREVLFELDKNGCIRFLNPGWQQITGYPISTSYGRYFGDFLLHQEDRNLFMPNRLPGIDLNDMQIEMRASNRDNVWVELDVHATFDDHGKFNGVIGSFQDITQRVQYERAVERHQEELFTLSITDSLTGIYNRRHFDTIMAETLATAMANDISLCLVLIDLDGFKFINDTYGHPIGDKVLCTLAGLLDKLKRPDDILARLAGDEFALILQDTDLQMAKDMSESLLRIINTTQVALPIGHLQLQASIGIAVAPVHGTTAGELVGAADVALYQSKRKGRGRVEVLSTDISQAIREVFSRGFELRNALAADDIQPTFQPIYDLGCGKPIAYEVLANMRRGDVLLPAQEFIKVAEDLGLVREIDLHIISQALTITPVDTELFLNISLMSFNEGSFADNLREILQPSLRDGRPVTIEITERETGHFSIDLLKEIQALKDLDCKIALDDFGQGYSTYDYLRRFRPEYIKIDSAYVGNMLQSNDDRMIVEHIRDLATSFGAIAIAEGIENNDIHEAVNAMGIRCGQGYHLGLPADADSLFSHTEPAA